MTLAEAIQWGISELQDTSGSPRLDAEILLRELLACPNSYLFSHPESILNVSQKDNYQRLLARRKQGEPIAYLTGHKEFWSLDLKVTVDTLIPRPETELLVERILALFPLQNERRCVADLGTGSGALALALASERPLWEIYACDQSAPALAIASENAKNLNIQNVHFCKGSWCAALPSFLFDAIVSNPPYLSLKEWQQVSKDLTFEPQSAFTAGEEGLDALTAIIQTAKAYLHPGGYLLLEHGKGQAAAVRARLEAEAYTDLCSYPDFAGIERVALGRRKSLE